MPVLVVAFCHFARLQRIGDCVPNAVEVTETAGLSAGAKRNVGTAALAGPLLHFPDVRRADVSELVG